MLSVCVCACTRSNTCACVCAWERERKRPIQEAACVLCPHEFHFPLLPSKKDLWFSSREQTFQLCVCPIPLPFSDHQGAASKRKEAWHEVFLFPFSLSGPTILAIHSAPFIIHLSIKHFFMNLPSFRHLVGIGDALVIKTDANSDLGMFHWRKEIKRWYVHYTEMSAILINKIGQKILSKPHL